MLLLFFLFWLVMNKRVTVEIAVLGIVVSCLMYLFCRRFIGISPATEKKVFLKFFSVMVYIFMLIVEMFKANIKMVKIILSPSVDTKPQIKYFNSPVRSDIAKVALANSINLTPGTVLVDMEGDRFGVHAIDASMLTEIDFSWNLVQKLREIEGGH